MTLAEAEAKLHNLMYGKGKWYFAYAMGAGCTIEDSSHMSQTIRAQHAELTAFIRRERNRQRTKEAQ